MKKKMKLRTQVVLVNACIVAGLLWQYLRGARTLAVVLTGIPLLVMVNIIFFVRMERPKNLS